MEFIAMEFVAMSARLRRLSGRLHADGMADWLKGAGWVLASSMAERVAAMAQTVLIARAIGIADYGLYGLFFATIGALTPLANLQLGYAVVVHLARNRANPAAAGAVLVFSELLTNLSAGLLLLLSVLFGAPLSQHLFGSPDYAFIVGCGGAVLFMSGKIGIYDAVLQVFDEFSRLALARVGVALVTLAMVGIVALRGGTLTEIIVVLTIGLVLRIAAVLGPALAHARPLRAGISRAQVVGQWRILLTFCAPSALVSFIGGYTVWVGLFALSSRPQGLQDVAVINASTQWRSPLLLITAALATSLLPRLSHALASGDHARTRVLSGANTALNVGLSLAVCLGVALFVHPILSLYGPGFAEKAALFLLFLLPVVLAIYANAHQQVMVAAGQMWLQAWCLLPSLVIVAGGVRFYGEDLTGQTLGYLQLAASVTTALVVGLVSHRLERRRAETAATGDFAA